jgi:predicted enzyme related to lactoylglutathione lyase
VLGIPFEGEDSYPYNESMKGVNHFALWLLSKASESYFGTETWPSDIPVPQGWIEFAVEDIAAATAEVEARGYHIFVAAQKMPWGQIVTRFLSPEGLLIEFSEESDANDKGE